MRTMIRTLLIVAVVIIGAMFLFGFPNGSSWRSAGGGSTPAVGTTGVVNTEKARERGAELGEKGGHRQRESQRDGARRRDHHEDQSQDGARRHGAIARDRRVDRWIDGDGERHGRVMSPNSAEPSRWRARPTASPWWSIA